MSSRTKSFFEQDHKAKPRPGSWNRPRQDRVPLSESSTNTAPARPPIPATSQAKSKLKAFQFLQPNEQQGLGIGQENAEVTSKSRLDAGSVKPAVSNTSTPAPQHASVSAESSKQATENANQTPQLPHANTFPSTPGARLSLEDLIGNYDETRQVQEKEKSPEEQLGWVPNSSSTLTPNRRRKRARSSSPSCPNTSSQRQEPSGFFGGNALPAEKHTPEADPAAELWHRYANAKDSAGILKLSDLPDIVFPASPRPLETPAKSGGLRRWASTGNDWPNSRTKKRRTNANVSVWQQNIDETSGPSKIAAMVEKIQTSLATQQLSKPKSAARGDEPSSSSPLPDTGAEFPSYRSPLRKKPAPPVFTVNQRLAPMRPPQHKIRAEAAVVSKEPARAEPMEETPAMRREEPTFTAAPLHLQSRAPLPAYKRPSISRTPSVNLPPPAPVVTKPTALPTLDEDSDEFADGMDLSAEDLDELLSQKPLQDRGLYDIPAHANLPPAPQAPVAQIQRTEARVADPPAKVPFLDDDDDDEFGDFDIDDEAFMAAEMGATQGLRSPRKRSQRKLRKTLSGMSASSTKSRHDLVAAPRKYQRFVARQVVEGEYTDSRGRRSSEKILSVEDERTRTLTAVTLRGSWSETQVMPGNIVHVAQAPHVEHQSQSLLPGQIMIDDKELSPLLIVHPDHMLSATTVADSFDCLRKAVLQDRIKATGESNKAMVYGKILHEVFQQALSANQWYETFLAELVEKTIAVHVEGLWELGMCDTVLATEEVRAKMGELAAWAGVFVTAAPSDKSLVDDRQGGKVWMSISKLIAIEEHVWSPQFGLKGNIDATIQATLLDNPQEAPKKLIMPFEVKTGRTTQSPAHRAQTALYTLLLSDRYDASVKAGILYYLESSSMTRIAPPTIETRQMVQQRNRLASYINRARYPPQSETIEGLQMLETEKSGLPPPLKNAFKCGKCYAQQSCFSFHALAEEGSADSAGMIDDGKKNHSLVWHEAVGHLVNAARQNNKNDAQTLSTWFSKWERLLTFEESELSRFRKELWTMSSSEREEVGRAFGGLVLLNDMSSTSAAVTSSIVDGIQGSGGRINRFAYVFGRPDGVTGRPFAEGSQLTVGEPIVVSTEQGQWALANGYVIAVSKTSITVAVDRKLGDARSRLAGFDGSRKQVLKGIMAVDDDEAHKESRSPTLYRLDKDEFSNGLALIRNSLVSFMSSHPTHRKLRDLIVLGAEPSFAASSPLAPLPPSQLGDMNDDQRAAVGKVLSAQDYALILGMPGTGKTTTIAHIIRALLAEGKSILLTSYTHTAVDNILLKIRDIAPPGSILRLGVPAKINPQVQEFCQLAATPKVTIDEVEDAYMSSRIVATTCMGTNHALFNRRAFDVCIVDEASQITLPTSLGPLLHAGKFVLVGDHYQLPPLVQNRAALEGGLDVSLFRQLTEQHPSAVAELRKQYRMCEEIMSLSNSLIYDGKLKCGNEAVASRTLQLSNSAGLQSFHRGSVSCKGGNGCWLKSVTSPQRKVLFVNIDGMGKAALETLTSGKNITNQLEATLTAQTVASLLTLGVPGREIGVITLYRSQLALLRQVFKANSIGPEVEIDSADRFQGRDKECIILSMVRSNETGNVGELLKDWRRVNVALTRARTKLVVLGSRKTLGHNDLLKKFLVLVDERGWSMELPDDVDVGHDFGFSTQASALEGKMQSPKKQTKSHSQVVLDIDSPVKLLGSSQSAANRDSAKAKANGGIKKPGKVITGSRGSGSMKARMMKECLAMDIFEDLTADDF